MPGVFAVLALLFIFMMSTTTKMSSKIQKFVMRDGHSVGEIKPFLSLIQLISGIIFVGFAIGLISRTAAAVSH